MTSLRSIVVGLFAAAVLLLVALVYQWRVRRIAAAQTARFDRRLAERTRIARDFHDALLQTMQGCKMVADDALGDDAGAPQMRRALIRLSGWLSQGIQEGRAALHELRNTETESNDLAAALQRAGEECRFERPITFRFSMEGASRDLHPTVRDEVYRIGYEAIRNACNHSEGDRLTVELSYASDLVLRVRDDGKGFHADRPADGAGGRFGMAGMYERATRIPGRLTISSSPGGGTQVELVVPRSVAFRGFGEGLAGVGAL